MMIERGFDDQLTNEEISERRRACTIPDDGKYKLEAVT